MIKKAPVYLDKNTTLDAKQTQILNSLFLNRWNWLRTRFKQKTERDAVVSNSSSRNTARVTSLTCFEYNDIGIASGYAYVYGLEKDGEYKLFEVKSTPSNVVYNGVLDNYASKDVSEYGSIYFKDKACYFKPSNDIDAFYLLFTIKWSIED